MRIRMSERAEDEKLCLDVGAVITAYHQIVAARNFALIYSDRPGQLGYAMQQVVDKIEELEAAGFVRVIDSRKTTMMDDMHAVGATEFSTTIPGAEIVRVYPFPDELKEESESTRVGLPKVEGGFLKAYLAQICGEDESMIAAVPSEDYHDPYVFYHLGYGFVEQLNKGIPLTGNLEFYPSGLDM